MSLRLITAPTIAPVSLADVKAHLRAGEAEDDQEIYSLIIAARDFVEKNTQRILLSSQYQYSEDCFVQEFEMPISPIISVVSIKYIDVNGAEQTLPSTDYQVDAESLVPRIKPAYGKSWPAVQPGYNAVKILFNAGYGASQDDVPASIKQAMLLLIGHWFENREAIIVGSASNQIAFTVDALLAPFQRY